jgi:SAM-dependent methyltransferase
MKSAIKRLASPVASHARRIIREETGAHQQSHDQQVQRNIMNQYINFRLAGIAPYPRISDAGFRVYSQFEEDGIILYVLSMIGFKSRKVAELCCGAGHECMAANLILNHGFKGFLFDGSEANIEVARSFFNKPDTLLNEPVIKRAWINAENVNHVLICSGCEGEIDLLSLDLDGNEYWVWKAIDCISPRLVVCETQNAIPSNLSLTIPYEANFSYLERPEAEHDFRSASLLAMTNLARKKGYRLIGGHRFGFNTFFLRNDEGCDLFPEIMVEVVHDNAYTKAAQKERWVRVKHLPWTEV